MWCTTSGIKVSKWPEAFLRLLVIGKCLALGLEDMGGVALLFLSESICQCGFILSQEWEGRL